jgi:hypothetical protein
MASKNELIVRFDKSPDESVTADGHRRNFCTTLFWHNARMPDEHALTLPQADRIHTDLAAFKSELQVIQAQLARIPTRRELHKCDNGNVNPWTGRPGTKSGC